MITLECINEAGFEDQLTAGFYYVVVDLGANSFLIINDTGETNWYGMSHFKMKAAQL